MLALGFLMPPTPLLCLAGSEPLKFRLEYWLPPEALRPSLLALELGRLARWLGRRSGCSTSRAKHSGV